MHPEWDELETQGGIGPRRCIRFDDRGGAVVWWLKPWAPDIVLTVPGETGERVDEGGLFANYFPVDAKRGPGVLLLGGSEGGIGADVTRRAIDLRSKGFSVLSPSYFGAPGQLASLSKGAEAALLVAVRHPELRAVVAGAPSSVVWDGIDWSNPINPDSSWTSEGMPLVSLAYGLFRPWNHIGRVYEDGLKNLDQHRDSEIQIERLIVPVLVCGEADTLWPSCRMSRRLRSRAAEEGGPRVRILAYERARTAGHLSSTSCEREPAPRKLRPCCSSAS